MFKHILSSIGVIKISYCDYNREEYNKYIGKKFTKKEFYDKFPNFKPYKVINKNVQQVYNVGFNKINRIDTFINKPESFRKDDCYICGTCGFYVTDNSNIPKYLSFDYNIAQIIIPDTSMIYLVEDEIKVSEMIIEKIIGKTEYCTNLDKEGQLEAVKHNGFTIKYIENPDKEVQLEAVKQNEYAINYIKNPDKDVQLEAVKQNKFVIYNITNPDKDVQLEAVKQDAFTIMYIKNPDKDVQLEAVKQDAFTIMYIKNPDKDVQLEAVKQNGEIIK